MSAAVASAANAGVMPDNPVQPVGALLADATKLGATFRLSGAEVVCDHAERLPQALRTTLSARRDDIWTHLGGDAAARPSLDLLAKLGVSPIVPQTEAEALALIAEIEADADRTGGDKTGQRNIGLDIETAALPGQEDRPTVRLTMAGRVAGTGQPKPGTAALDPRRSVVRLAQVCGGGARCLVLDTRLVPLTVLTPVLGRRIAVAHNAKFELAFLTAAGIDLPRFECTMQGTGLLLGVYRRGLDDAASTYLGIDLPKGLGASDWSADALSAGQIAYAALDAIVVLQLWRKLREELRNTGRGRAYQLQRDVTPVVARMEARGLLVDRFEHYQQVTSWGIALSDAQRDLLALLHARRPGKLNEDSPKLPRTPAEVRRLLTDVLPPDVLDAWLRTKGGDLSTQQAELKKQRDVPEVAQLVEIAAHTKLITSFGTRLIAQISASTGRLHANFKLAAAKTGRFASSEPNLQQLPNKKARHFRECIIPAPGNHLVLGDYATMELRAAAEISNDADLRQAFADGIDLHRTQAAETLGIDPKAVTDAQREGAKPINFGVVYGMGPAALVATAWGSYGIVLTIDQATAARDALLARFPTLARWQRTHADQCERLGRIKIGRLGRVIEAAWEKPTPITGFVRVNDNGDDDDEDADEDDLAAEEAWNRTWSGPQVRRLRYALCCNAPVQGACADAVMLAMFKVDHALRAANIPGGLVLSVHDELVLEVPIERADEAGVILEREMVAAFVEMFPGAPTTNLVAIKQGNSWSAAKSR